MQGLCEDLCTYWHRMWGDPLLIHSFAGADSEGNLPHTLWFLQQTVANQLDAQFNIKYS